MAQGALLDALLRARLTPVGRLVAPTAPTAARAARAARAAGAAAEAAIDDGQARAALVARTVRALDRAARRGLFRPSCLVRSLALLRLLERGGVSGARMRIGVRREGPGGAERMVADASGAANFPVGGGPQPTRPPHPAGRMLAHAWVELDGRIVGDEPRHVATFTPLGSLSSLPFRWR